jgi:hypothetical protein
VCCSRVSPDSGVCREPCLRREVFPSGGTVWETIEPESCVIVAGDSEGEELVGLVLKRASDAYGEYRVGLTQA